MMDWADVDANIWVQAFNHNHDQNTVDVIASALRKAKADGMREAAEFVKSDAAEGDCDFAAFSLVRLAIEIEKGNA